MLRIDDLENKADASIADRHARILGCAGLWLLLTVPALGGGRTDLDRDWQFRADPELAGDAGGWNSSIPPGTQPIDVPHTWNAGALHDYLGVAWYFHRFYMPPLVPGAHVELHFGATFYDAHVWLNGAELGGHEGGFTAYAFDVTSKLRAQNVLAVRIDNRPGAATIPGIAERGSPGPGSAEAKYDWWTYGGIVRDVWLTTSGTAWVGRQAASSDCRKR
jgi:beta-glucuronidase